jgi:GNAT superfamily N-acetyltransferase
MTQIVPFSESLVEPAAALVVDRAMTARQAEPLLGPVFEDPAYVTPLFAGVSSKRLGVAAIENGRLAGFLAAFPFEFWGSQVAYVPEWAFAADRADITTAMYREASSLWQQSDRTVHTVTLWANDPDGEAPWHHMGFGRVVIDSLREITLAAMQGKVRIRRAGPEDAETVARFGLALWEYLAGPPVFRIHPQPEGTEAAHTRLGEPARPVWLATKDDEVIGFLSLGPSEGPAPLTGNDLIRCDAAFVVAEHRHTGAGQSLFASAMNWAVEAGLKRLAVDYESANPEASRFWPAVGCRPVMHAVARRLAE